MAVIYIALSCALVISFTTAKYADVRTLFTDFRAAQFNVAILMQDITQEETEAVMTLKDLRPGMTGLDAVRLPFCVSNGPDEQTTAKVGIKYTVQIRTAQYLPLEFKLEERSPVTAGETVQYQTRTYLANETVDRIDPEAGSQDHVWYQYSFLPDAVSAEEGAANTAPQMEFELTPEILGEYQQNQHVLVVEWPEDQGEDSQYMKEVEPIHILVTAHSINRTEEENYVPETLPAGDTYTAGIILLEDGRTNTFYDLDLRAFHKTQRTFQFWIDNGVGQGMPQTRDRIDYGVDLLLPLEKVGNPGIWQQLKLSFQLDGKYTFHLEQDQCVIYNEKTQQYTRNADGSLQKFTLAQIRGMELLPEERPYGFYIGGNATLLNYMKDETAQKVTTANRQMHTITISGTDLDRITDEPFMDSFSFLNKAKLLITAEFKDEAVAPDPTEETTEPGETEASVPQP